MMPCWLLAGLLYHSQHQRGVICGAHGGQNVRCHQYHGQNSMDFASWRRTGPAVSHQSSIIADESIKRCHLEAAGKVLDFHKADFRGGQTALTKPLGPDCSRSIRSCHYSINHV